MQILALDQGTSSGWAFTKNGKVAYGTKQCHSVAGNDGVVFDEFERWLDHMVLNAAPDIIVFETPIFRGKRSIYLHGFSCLIYLVAHRRKIPVLEVHLATSKKNITGKGNASKDEVIASITGHGFKPATDHEADALALLLYSMKRQPP